MPQITLAKALKLKNRLAGRLTKVQEDIATYNSVLEEQVDKFNVVNALKEREQIQESLIDVKTAIIKANAPIQGMLIRHGELRSKIDWLKYIPIRDGVERHGYQNTEVTYVACLKKQQLDEEIKNLEKQIDGIQDEVDAFNHTTKVEVTQETLNLAS